MLEWYNLLMALAIILTALLVCFFLVHHHVGVPFLAMIAGLAVYNGWGASFATTINQWIPAIDIWVAQQVLYVLFVIAVPLALYFRAGKSGLFGIMRGVESAIFALMLTMLMSGLVAQWISFDELSVAMVGWIEGIQPIVMVVGIIFAYVDTFLYRAG